MDATRRTRAFADLSYGADVTRRARTTTTMSVDEVKKEVKEDHMNIKVRDMVRRRARGDDARSDGKAKDAREGGI